MSCLHRARRPPWWKRRALRIFRDESSLSANPHLWSSITDALDDSGWFILLLYPDAAASPWVNDEVEYWLEHKHSDRIIPVLTDGEFAEEMALANVSATYVGARVLEDLAQSAENRAF